MTIRAIGQLSDEGKLVDIERKAPNDAAVTKEIIINLSQSVGVARSGAVFRIDLA